MIPPMEWNEIIEDAKEKRLHENRGNEPAQGEKRNVMIVLSTM